MTHHLAILVPLPSGKWRAHIPDYPECVAEAEKASDATMLAAACAEACAQQKLEDHKSLPHPRDLQSIQHDSQWCRDHHIDWRSSVISMVRLAERGNGSRRPF